MVRRSLLTMRPAARIGGGVMSNSRLDQSITPSKPTPESILADAREQRQEVVAVYTEEHARRLEADLNELREMRKERGRQGFQAQRFLQVAAEVSRRRPLG